MPEIEVNKSFGEIWWRKVLKERFKDFIRIGTSALILGLPLRQKMRTNAAEIIIIRLTCGVRQNSGRLVGVTVLLSGEIGLVLSS
jgi:hypothetical protein